MEQILREPGAENRVLDPHGACRYLSTARIRCCQRTSHLLDLGWALPIGRFMHPRAACAAFSSLSTHRIHCAQGSSHVLQLALAFAGEPRLRRFAAGRSMVLSAES